MANADRLIQASQRLYGPEADNVGREVTYTHEVVAGHRIRIVRHDLSLIKKRILAAEMFHSDVNSIYDRTLDRFDELELEPDFVAEIAESNLDPEWVLHSSRRKVRRMAQLLSESRVIVLAFQKMGLDMDAKPGELVTD